MATINVKSDVHALSVVWSRTTEYSDAGKPRTVERWFKIAILGGEGSVSDKFQLLYESPLQHRVSTAIRERDAKSSDTYYPRGCEAAQLFSVLANMVGVVCMDGFDAMKWVSRLPKGSQAVDRLYSYDDAVREEEDARIAEAAAQRAAEESARLEAEEAARIAAAAPGTDRITPQEDVPVQPTTDTGKKGRKVKVS